jgi:hypothetical protein
LNQQFLARKISKAKTLAGIWEKVAVKLTESLYCYSIKERGMS